MAAGRLGEDRSAEFGWAFSLAPEHDTGIAYIFLDRYLDRVYEVESFFPDGARYDSVADDGIVSFSAYLVPQPVVIAERPPGAVPTPVQDPLTTERDRDVIRVQDLTALQGALQEYMDDQGSYPNTGGVLETLCEASDLDAGCELERTLNPLPEDPLGDPGANGYWYISDGETYTLYAQRESQVFLACLHHPETLATFDSLFCFSSR
ncbi:MAG: type II secretion system protein GspG [Planctomycetes bacterium]|nr:type II secretion system protein GspG [Planctomycetota bacterium]